MPTSEVVVVDYQAGNLTSVALALRHLGYEPRITREPEVVAGAERVIFPGVGHNPVFEIPDEYHGELIRFLRSDPNEPADQSWVDTDVGVRR